MRTQIVCVRIVKEKFLREAAEQYPKAEKFLTSWVETVKAATWKDFTAVRATYGSADSVKVASGNTVVVFDVNGNTYRLIVALHYNTRTAYTLRFMTHAEYDKENWKKDL